MATWGPIQLRLKGSRQVEFDGEASPAPGGGSPQQALYHTTNGAFVTIADGGVGNLLWNRHDSGPELLDRTDAAFPLFLAVGTYALTLMVTTTAPLTAGGFCSVQPFIAENANLVNQTMDHPEVGDSMALVEVVTDITQPLSVLVQNLDGAASRDFGISAAILVKLA